MRVAVIGVGHVGLVSAACLARWGHDVVGMDDDSAKIETLRSGTMPFHEPGLAELVDEGVAEGRLTFTDDLTAALDGAAAAFVCVGTPSLPGGAPNLSYVERVGREAAVHATDSLVLIEKSTVPANTGVRLQQVIAREQARAGHEVHVEVASNPEFLREGSAVEDTLYPDRIVIGAGSERAGEVVRAIYEPLLAEHDVPVIQTDLQTAELIKHASNGFLAMKISFINAVAHICDAVGADVEAVADGMGYDHRIGRSFLHAGLGWGGSCLVGEETVLVRRDGAPRHMTIADFWAHVTEHGLDGWEVLAWHPERRRPEYLPVGAATARPYQSDLIEVRTKTGRRLRCTTDHPFVVGDGATVATTVKLAEELTTTDWLPLACGRQTPDFPDPVAVSTLAAVGAGKVSEGDVIQRLDPAQVDEVRERAAAIPTPRRYDVLRNGTIRLDESRGLGHLPPGGTYGTATNGTYVPDLVPLDEDFWRMIGLFLAEGHVSTDGRRMRVSWSFHPTDEGDLVEFVHAYWEQQGVKVSNYRAPTAANVSISSRLLASWFIDVLELGADAYTKRVPDLIWDAPYEHKRALLRGLWDGDGSWSLVNDGPSVILEYGTVSPMLADGILRLLSDLGFVASLRVGRTAKSTVDTYWIRLSGADQIEAALWLFPPGEAAEIQANIGRQSKRIAPTGHRWLGDGSTWVRVTETRREHFDGLVYSLEVPDAHTIVTTGGLVTHNCFPKDVDAFVHLASSVGYEFKLLEEVRAINLGQLDHVMHLLASELWHLEGKTVTLLGAAFKPGTDDLRNAPAIDLAHRLLEAGADVRIYDPVATSGVKEVLPDVEVFEEPVAACTGAHAVVVCTEWDEIRQLEPHDLVAALAYPVLIDGRNVFDPAAMVAAGLAYHSIGRPVPGRDPA
ncbi:MAG: nucleotide sugar dehydrogenase [Actinobacteria bacterium]|nr:nucleotide sugar dehydrogenase [Actinomycetota bacterium]